MANDTCHRSDDADIELELTILMPCLDEAETIGTCISKANSYIAENNIAAEVVIADNGSTDGSQFIATNLGARVVRVAERGYGSALQAGIEAAYGKFVIMGDADGSYDFSALDPLIERLREGNDLVMGNRFRGGIAPGAMPALHRYFGNPILSGLGRLFFGTSAADFQCGLRGFNREAIQRLDLQTRGMEFASEMVVKATLSRYKITEVPTTLSPAGRSRAPHLRSWYDGWRYLRFLLLYCPRWLFLYPGLLLIAFGLLMSALVLPAPLEIGSIIFDVHTLLVSTSAIIVGVQIVIFFFLARKYAVRKRLLPSGPGFEWYLKAVSLERAVLLGFVITLAGIAGLSTAVMIWHTRSFGQLDYSNMMRLVVPSVTALSVGVQIVMGGFLSSLMDIDSNSR